VTKPSPRERSIEFPPQQLSSEPQSCPLLDVSFVDDIIQASPDAKDVWRKALNVGQQRIHERSPLGKRRLGF